MSIGDWIDDLIAAAKNQGFEVRETGTSLAFTRDGVTVVIDDAPGNVFAFVKAVDALRAVGLRFPEK